MKLYGNPVSGNSHRVKNLLGLLGQPFEDVVVDLKNGEHKTPAFLALNPLGQVPVFQDGDLILRDSVAILVYLARKYDDIHQWLPTDARAQAEIQQWLSIATNEIQSGPFVVRIIKLLGAPLDYKAAHAKTEALFGQLFEPHLKQRQWLAGDKASLADIACYSYIACVEDGEFSLEPYPAIRAWLKRLEAIEGFSPMPSAKQLFGG